MAQRANKKRVLADRIRELQKASKEQFALARQDARGVKDVSPQGSGIQSGGTSVGQNFTFVRKTGDVMTGAFGLFPKVAVIQSGVLDLQQQLEGTDADSSTIIATPESGTLDDITSIDNPRFFGQLLFLRSQSTDIITLKNNVGDTPILTIGGGDYQVATGDTVLLQYNGTTNKWAQLTHSQTLGADLNLGAFSITDAFDIETQTLKTTSVQYINDPTVVFHTLSGTGHIFEMATTGDQFIVKAGAAEAFKVTENSVELATGFPLAVNDSLSITHATNAYIEISDIVDPSTPISGFGRVFLDSADDILKILHSDASVVDLEGGSGGPPFDDNQVIIQDEVDTSKTLTFNLTLLATGNAHLINFASSTGSRTFTFPDNTGTMAMLNLAQSWSALQTFSVGATFNGIANFNSSVNLGNDSGDTISVAGRIDTDIIATPDNVRNLGSITQRWAGFSSTLYRLPTTTTDSTTRILSNSGGIEYRSLASPDTHEFFVSTASQFEINSTGVRIGSTSSNTIDGDGGGMTFGIDSTDVMTFKTNLATMFSLDSSSMIMNSVNIVLSGSAHIDYVEISPPSGSVNSCKVYCDNLGAGGKTRLMGIFQSGVAQVIATEP